MNELLLATFITGVWLLLTILLSISLADVVPPDFMKRDYTGVITKPKPAAQIAFLSIGGTFVAAFFAWTAKPFISHFYDYLNASLLTVLAIWWFLILVITAIIRQTDGLRWVRVIVPIAVFGLGFFVIAVRTNPIGFLTEPYLFVGIVTEKNVDRSKYGATYTIVIDNNSYMVTRIAYSELHIGDTANLIRTEFDNMAFPVHHAKSTWLGALLLILNSMILASMLMIIGNGFVGEVEKS